MDTKYEKSHVPAVRGAVVERAGPLTISNDVGGSAIFRHFKMESATQNWNPQPQEEL